MKISRRHPIASLGSKWSESKVAYVFANHAAAQNKETMGYFPKDLFWLAREDLEIIDYSRYGKVLFL